MTNKAKIKYFILLMVEKNFNFNGIEAVRNRIKIIELIIKLTLDNIINNNIPKKKIIEWSILSLKFIRHLQ